MISMPYIRTADGLTVFFDNENLPVNRLDPDYRAIVKLLSDEATTDEALRAALIPVRQRLEDLVAKHSKDGFTLTDGVVYRNGLPLNAYMSAKLEAMLDEGWDLKPIANFLNNLDNNPSYRVVEDLYSFLEYGQMPITADGHFLAYKYVNQDYMDAYSGTYDNSPGKICEMPRNKVDEDPDRTCSAGLHVCSYEYLPSYGVSCAYRVVICKINPADVVAIPRDYNNTKMRVSKYLVLADLPEDHSTTRRPLLSERPVFNDHLGGRFDDPDDDYLDDEDDDNWYSVEARSSTDDLDWEELAAYSNLDEARDTAYAEFRLFDEIRIVNQRTDETVLSLRSMT